LNQRPLGYEPRTVRHISRPATTNPKQKLASSVATIGRSCGPSRGVQAQNQHSVQSNRRSFLSRTTTRLWQAGHFAPRAFLPAVIVIPQYGHRPRIPYTRDQMNGQTKGKTKPPMIMGTPMTAPIIVKLNAIPMPIPASPSKQPPRIPVIARSEFGISTVSLTLAALTAGDASSTDAVFDVTPGSAVPQCAQNFAPGTGFAPHSGQSNRTRESYRTIVPAIAGDSGNWNTTRWAANPTVRCKPVSLCRLSIVVLDVYLSAGLA
jgi:hypothetical protein